MAALHPVDLVIVALYLVAMIAVGFLLVAGVKAYQDFFLAGLFVAVPVSALGYLVGCVLGRCP